MEGLNVLNGSCLAQINGFPAKHGLTTNKFGDFGFDNPLEREQNLRLLKLAQADLFFKIIPEHSDGIKIVAPTNKICNWLKGDALICLLNNFQAAKPMLISNTADCPTIFFTDQKNIIALAHSGWRGTAKKIVVQVIEKLKLCFAIEPQNIKVGLWGGICSDCYYVGSGLNKYFQNKIKNSHLSLTEIIVEQLLAAKVKIENIYWPFKCCSAHSSSKGQFLFASYRRDQNHFRNAAFITF